MPLNLSKIESLVKQKALAAIGAKAQEKAVPAMRLAFEASGHDDTGRTVRSMRVVRGSDRVSLIIGGYEPVHPSRPSRHGTNNDGPLPVNYVGSLEARYMVFSGPVKTAAITALQS